MISVKNEKGQYGLSERGKLALKLSIEFTEQDDAIKVKGAWWQRFWILAIVLQVTGLLLVMSLTYLGYMDFILMVQSIVGLSTSTVLLYFFYKLIHPISIKKVHEEQKRTVRDIFVTGRHLQEVKKEVYRWIDKQGIILEAEKEDFFRGRLGTPSGLGLTAPKYFEVSLKPKEDGVMVHTEGWISIFDVNERCFSKTALAFGGIPRRKGWKVMDKLWQSMETPSG
jgi:hypothetical protein